MKALVRIELKKAIKSKFFLLGLALMLLFSVLSGIYMIENRATYNPEVINEHILQADGTYKNNPDLPLFGFYNSWVGGEALSLFQTLFYNLLPIGAAIPYAWSYHTERKSGYLKSIASRTDKKKYFVAKAIAVFTSGVLVVLIPILVNIIMVSAFVPFVEPFAGYTFYNYHYVGEMWIEYYFTNPMLYVALYVLLDTLYGGLYALLSFAVAFYIKNILAVLFMPYLFVAVLGYLENIIITNGVYEAVYAINPSLYLHSLMYGGMRMWWIILPITLVLLIFALGTIFIRGFRDEIF